MSDLISRQMAIDKINERQRNMIYCFGFENDAVKIMDIAKSIIIATPSAQPEVLAHGEGDLSAQPEREKGEWIRDKKTEKEEQLMFLKVWTCSECGERQCRPKPSNFCPNCGADMRGEQDDER